MAEVESELGGIAFKTVYNDGGPQSGLFGYRDTCTRETILYNVERKQESWCSHESNLCRQYCDRGANGMRPINPCYESQLLNQRQIRFATGVYHTGKKKGEPIPIDYQKVKKGTVAFLTTRGKDASEKDRVVYAVFRVGKVSESEDGHYIESDGKTDLILPDPIAMNCKYWQYKRKNRNGGIFWGSGLFRYVEAKATVRLLSDLAMSLRGSAEEEKVIELLGGRENLVLKPSHADLSKYGGGGGGESAEHKKLKKRVARDPTLIGLPADSEPVIEHRFITNNHVDVKFDLPNGTAAVVEIETTEPNPGAHQAVMYRSLLQVERGEALSSKRVRAILVAHRFDEETYRLAKKYNIELFKGTSRTEIVPVN